MKEIFAQFTDLLESRFRHNVLTTEDSVRCTLFAAMLRNGISPEEVILEYPHSVIPRAQIDMWLPDRKGKPVAIEFKYDRDPPGGKNQPKTQKAGYVFRDIYRLLLVGKETNSICYFVYVTTEEMAVYFNNPNNGYDDFFGLLPGKSMEFKKGYFSGKPMTFNNTLGGEFEAKVISVLSKSLPSGHKVRIYEVQSR